MKTFEYQTCKWCKLLYQPVDWLTARVEGYCCENCLEDALEVLNPKAVPYELENPVS